MKTQIQRLISWACLAGLAVAGPAALAHGEGGHAKVSAPVRQEQKPWGIAPDAKAAARTVSIEMSDTMRFKPDLIRVRQGETLRFVFRNKGRLLHEFVLGTKQELEAHAALMRKFPGMEHDEPYMVHVPAGKTAELRWTFNHAGSFEFACLIAGHYEAGMLGRVEVIAAAKADPAQGDGHAEHRH